jgi:hypothetical protein
MPGSKGQNFKNVGLQCKVIFLYGVDWPRYVWHASGPMLRLIKLHSQAGRGYETYG